MNDTRDKRDEIPEEFSSAEEAGRFWDTHDSTAYLDQMEPVEADVRLTGHHFEIEVGEDVMEALRRRAASQHVAASELANELLRKELAVR